MPYVIGRDCSTCHYCFYECPVKAIRFVGNTYAIDPEKCVECGKCARVCPTGRIAKQGEKHIPSLHPPTEIAADAVVLGAGGAGLVAAVRFAELTGKKVVVLEKAEKVGGSTNLGHAFVTRYTKFHRAAGMPDERDEAVEEIASDAQPGYPKELLRRAMYGLDDMFDWLTGFGGAEEEFELTDRRGLPQMGPFPHMPGLLGPRQRFQNVKSTDESMGPGWAGTFVVQKMMAQTERLGITVFTGVRADHIITDDDGRFRAVIAHDEGGSICVRAGVCLVASGGFSRNRALVERVRPSFYRGLPVHTFAAASNTGDAVAIAEELGAMIDLDTVKVPMFSPTHHPFTLSLVWLSNDPRVIMVNKNGERYFNEASMPGQTGALETQPEMYGWAIFDTPTAEAMSVDLIERGSRTTVADAMHRWKDDLEYECTLDLAAKKAGTIGELAEKLGMEPAALERTVDAYNAACADGSDILGKPARFLSPCTEGPFYALFQGRFNEGAVGGVVTDENLRMLKKDGEPFSGIYMAGDCCRGVLKKNDERSKFGEMPWAMASGWLAAQEMAAYVE